MLRRAIHIPEPQNIQPILKSLFTPDFSLEPDTLPPVNIFVPYNMLADALDLSGKANLFVSKQEGLSLPFSSDDFGLDLQPSTNGTLIKSKTIYLPSALKNIFSKSASIQTCLLYTSPSPRD